MTIVDVRTLEEFNGAHITGSLNIPLNEIPLRINEFSILETPIVLCCASRNRSRRAMLYLNSKGIDCENGGNWFNVNAL